MLYYGAAMIPTQPHDMLTEGEMGVKSVNASFLNFKVDFCHLGKLNYLAASQPLKGELSDERRRFYLKE